MNKVESYKNSLILNQIGKNSNVLLLFSGGLDSTYLLYKNLQNGNKITCIYTDIENNKVKSKIEISVINQIIKKFNKSYKEKIELYINSSNLVYIGGDVIFKQIPIHIQSIISSVNNVYDNVQIGYCMNDDAISYLDDISNIYNSYQPIFDDKLPTLMFPASKISKIQMLEDLPKKIAKLVFSCEDPVGSHPTPCGKCFPCKRYIDLLSNNKFKLPRLIK